MGRRCGCWVRTCRQRIRDSLSWVVVGVTTHSVKMWHGQISDFVRSIIVRFAIAPTSRTRRTRRVGRVLCPTIRAFRTRRTRRVLGVECASGRRFGRDARICVKAWRQWGARAIAVVVPCILRGCTDLEVAQRFARLLAYSCAYRGTTTVRRSASVADGTSIVCSITRLIVKLG